MEYRNKIFNCDVLEGLKQLPDECVNTVVTSPPYWGLRDYGTAEWIGGDPECNHVWTVPARGLSYAHFATFPQELIVDCIKAGAPEGGLVMDPFMGSGTTAVVARKLNRDYVGFELNPDYMKIINRRLEEELGMFK